MTHSEIARRLLAWYAQSARSLPWRDNQDPYAVWVSEIMLQQTRVETVIPYYLRWMELFPTVQSLASSSLTGVLQAWEGLGYYSRARNLHRAAQEVAARYGGDLPGERSTLQTLPGIGSYTAGAIASIAFGKDEPALDGNIRRVYARLFNLTLPASSFQGIKALEDIAVQHLPAGEAGNYNQALMDLGATICIPHRPTCPACPLNEFCQAYSLGVQEERPIMKQRPQTPHYTVTAAIIRRGNTVLLARRPEKGLLGGLWEFPGGKQEPGETLQQALTREIREELDAEIQVGEAFGIYKHAFTHFKITLHAFFCTLIHGEPRPIEATEIAWVLPGQLASYPMGKVDRRIARKLVAGE